MDEPTPEDAVHYLNQQFVRIWKERGLGELPKCLVSHSESGNWNVSFTSGPGRQSPFFTVDKTLTARGVMPEHPPVDLNDGDQFYDLIDRIISDVC